MNRSQGNLQDAFLNSARRENIGVTIYLVSGVQLRGVIRAFDAFTVLLDSQGRPPQMVYKHAIASIAPVRPVPVEGGAREERSDASPEAAEASESPAPAPAEGEAGDAPEAPENPESPESAPAAMGTTAGETDTGATPDTAPREMPVSA